MPSAAGAARSSSGSYNVAIITSLVGADAPEGIPAAGGMETAFDYINSMGGVQGHKIKYTVYDDQSSTDQSQTVAVQAIGATPTVIIDGAGSAFINARLATYTQAQLPMIAPVYPLKSLLPWLYGAGQTSQQGAFTYVRMVQQLVGGSLAGKKVAIEVIGVSAGLATADNCKTMIQNLGGTVTTTQIFPFGGTSFDSGATNIVATNPDAVITLDTAADTVIIAKALATAGYKGPMTVGPSASDPVTMQTVNSAQLLGVQTVQEIKHGGLVWNLAHKFKHTDLIDSDYFASGWAAAMTAKLALDRCAYPCAAAAFEEAIQSIGPFNIPGVTLAGGKWYVNKKIHSFSRYGQIIRWNPATQKFENVGKPVPEGPPGYTS
jgi:ABC-type branched-subunit amino acid transport system substrate-binding protein